ncbi:NADPH-Fe(3+) oxidoreductase subunit beta [subsurface metagenome]
MVEGRIQKPVLDEEKCNACLACVKGCPAEIIPEMRTEESSLRGRIYKDIGTAPAFNMDKVLGMPPCQLACPIYQDIRGYIELIAKGKYEEALALIREANPLPSVTGYICSHPCEISCVRNSVDDLVSIRALKRFVADFDDGRSLPPAVDRYTGKKVSIIGSGPAGLAAAYDLLRMGYQVELIEASPEPGGMLRYAIPPFRLPRNILERDVKYIEAMGVRIKTGVRFGIDVTLDDLKKEGTAAVIIAIGTYQGLKMGVENEGSTNGYIDCLAFLRDYARGEQVVLGDKVIVVGGGNAAIDAARSALRCGVKEVSILYRRSYQEMPADRNEIEEAQAEGVEINYLSAPVRIIEKGGEVRGLECVKAELGELDESGRRRPVPIAGSEFVVNATSIISAVGQQPDLSWNKEGLAFSVSPKNTLLVDDNCHTNIEGVFAAGDAVNGPTTVVEAMASGKKAASTVDVYLSGKA